jgi:hypothetical protein
MATDVAGEVLAFIRLGPPHIATFALSTTAAGAVSARQAGASIDDAFRIVTVARAGAVRATHVRRSGRLAYLFVGKALEHPARNVLLEGVARTIDDVDEGEAFLAERAAATGIAAPPGLRAGRVLHVVEPRLVRAEGFLPDGELALIRSFDPPLVERVPFGMT